jgi:hypothetical protein
MTTITEKIVTPTVERLKLSPAAKELFISYCNNEDVHSTLFVTYKDVAERVMSWLYKQPIETWNEVIKVLETEIFASKGYCFTGRLSRLVSVLDGFHPGVRISIASSDQISNRVLIVINKCKDEGISKEDTIVKIKEELKSLELDDTQIEEWMTSVVDLLDE